VSRHQARALEKISEDIEEIKAAMNYHREGRAG